MARLSFWKYNTYSTELVPARRNSEPAQIPEDSRNDCLRLPPDRYERRCYSCANSAARDVRRGAPRAPNAGVGAYATSLLKHPLTQAIIVGPLAVATTATAAVFIPPTSGIGGAVLAGVTLGASFCTWVALNHPSHLLCGAMGALFGVAAAALLSTGLGAIFCGALGGVMSGTLVSALQSDFGVAASVILLVGGLVLLGSTSVRLVFLSVAPEANS